jgi:uncharacterized protein (TIGR00730 family)
MTHTPHDPAMRADMNPYRSDDAWRIFRVVGELADGFEGLADIGPAVTMFGSARIESGPIYDEAVLLGRKLAEAGVAVISGGGPGTMAAVSQGAREGGGQAIGCTIELPHEQQGNEYLTKMLHHRYFFTRKLMLVRYSSGFVFTCGGYGTLDEAFEVLSLRATGILQPEAPLVFLGSDIWQPLVDWMRSTLVPRGSLSEEDLSHIIISDDVDEAVSTLVTACIEHPTDPA